MRRLRLALLVSLLAAAAACGQKSGVAGTGGAEALTSGAGNGTATGGGNAGGTTAIKVPKGPADRTGITDNEIVIGIHAPVTGAAPFPQKTFDIGKDVYWKFLNDKGGVLGGRKVRVVFRDDQFNPQRAVQVCREMVEKEKVFLLVGGGGADQITACAKYADQKGVPYVSAGVNESDLSDLSTFFALSMTYKRQSPILAKLIKDELKKTKVGVVVADTPSFKDGHDSFLKAAKDEGLDVVADDAINKDAQSGEALTEANKLKGSGADVVYVLTSPTTFFNLAKQGGDQGFRPTYVGPGITAGLNLVAVAGCPAVADARFLSPFPQLDAIDQMDPDYKPAYKKYAGKDADDIGLALWGLNKVLATLFEAAGKDMSRQSFIRTLAGGKEFTTGVYPPLKFSAKNHFGASQAHVLQAQCQGETKRYRTVARFASADKLAGEGAGG